MPSIAPGDAAAPFSSRPPSCWRAHSCTRSVVTPHSMIVIGSVIASGVTPSAGGGVHSASRSRISLRRATIGGQCWGPSATPPVAQVSVSSSSAEATSWRDSWNTSSPSSRKPMLCQQRAELADLVPPPRQEPVVAEELVLLDVREHGPRQGQQVVERRPRLLVEQRAVLVRQPLALALDLLGRAVDLLARAQRADVADQRRVRNARVVEPAAVVVVEPVAGRHVEPRVLDLLELVEPAAALPRSSIARRRSRPACGPATNAPSTPVSIASRASRRSSASGLNSSTSIPATICAMC